MNAIPFQHNRMVAVSGIVVELTPTEYRLVTRLNRSRGVVVGRDELYRELKDTAENELYGALTKHVGQLRKKLGPSAITTIWGVGFVMAKRINPTGGG